MRCLIRFLAALTLPFLAVPQIAVPQDDVVFRSGVSLIRLDVEAVDANGAILTGLTKDDFLILDEGVLQTPVNFSFEKEPLDLILLFDTAGSMKGKIHQVLRAVELGFHELQRGDRVCVMTFGFDATEMLPFTPNMDAVNQAIVIRVLGSQFSGGSNREQAAADSAMRFRREPVTARRRAVLVISDKPGPRGASAESAIRDLWQSDAVWSELVLDKPGQNRILNRAANSMADQTGGATMLAGDPGPAFQESLRRLRRRYTLYYQLPQATVGTQRRIQVELTPTAAQRFAGATIRARSGYIVKSPTAP